MREWEDKIPIGHLDTLHARRAELVVQVAPLRAMHGVNGKYKDVRDKKLAGITELIRNDPPKGADGNLIRLTEERIKALARTHQEFNGWLDDMLLEHAEMIGYEDEIKAIDEWIIRETAIIGFARTEAGLQR